MHLRGLPSGSVRGEDDGGGAAVKRLYAGTREDRMIIPILVGLAALAIGGVVGIVLGARALVKE